MRSVSLMHEVRSLMREVWSLMRETSLERRSKGTSPKGSVTYLVYAIAPIDFQSRRTYLFGHAEATPES